MSKNTKKQHPDETAPRTGEISDCAQNCDNCKNCAQDCKNAENCR